MYAQWTGSNWDIQKLENILKNSTFEAENAKIVDMTFDSKGNPALTLDGPVGNILGGDVTGDLTYTSVGTLPVSSFGNNLIIVIPTVLAIIVVLAVLIILNKKKKPLPS